MHAKDVLIKITFLTSLCATLSICAVHSMSVDSVSSQAKSGNDTVILKSGKVVVGTVQEVAPDKYIKVLTPDGKIHTYKMSAVVKISMPSRESEEIGEPTPAVAPAPPAPHQRSQGNDTIVKPAPGKIEQPHIGSGGTSTLRFGAGTDVTLGLGLGAGYTYQWTPGNGWPTLEIGPTVVYSKISKTTNGMDGPNWSTKDDETTTLFIFGIFFNELYQYNPGERGVYFLTGTGLAVVTVHYENTHSETYLFSNPDHISYPTETNTVDGTIASFVFNFGAGYFFSGHLGARIEMPIFIFFSTVGNTNTFSPAFLLTLQYRI